jgi:hypothetical protein
MGTSKFRLVISQDDPHRVAAELTRLAELARAGEIEGVAYVASHKGRAYSGDVLGSCRTNPVHTLGLAVLLREKIQQVIG